MLRLPRTPQHADLPKEAFRNFTATLWFFLASSSSFWCRSPCSFCRCSAFLETAHSAESPARHMEPAHPPPREQPLVPAVMQRRAGTAGRRSVAAWGAPEGLGEPRDQDRVGEGPGDLEPTEAAAGCGQGRMRRHGEGPPGF